MGLDRALDSVPRTSGRRAGTFTRRADRRSALSVRAIRADTWRVTSPVSCSRGLPCGRWQFDVAIRGGAWRVLPRGADTAASGSFRSWPSSRRSPPSVAPAWRGQSRSGWPPSSGSSSRPWSRRTRARSGATPVRPGAPWRDPRPCGVTPVGRAA